MTELSIDMDSSCDCDDSDNRGRCPRGDIGL